MQRRSFFRWMAALGVLVRLPRGLRAQTLTLTPEERVALDAVGRVVLPATLGQQNIAAVVEAFLGWAAGYREHADLGYGYGHPQTRWSGASPAANYAEQLQALGDGFAMRAAGEQRTAVESALAMAHVTRLPRRPNGQHVASDLMGYYFNSASGEDYLYQARIMRDACRGLDGSSARPQAEA